MKSLRRKIDFYILSLGLLFIFFVIIALKPPASFSLNDIENWISFIQSNPLPVISTFGLFYCLFAYIRFTIELKGANELPFKIEKLENINYKHLTFLATYIVPLISFDFCKTRQMIVLGLLLVVMGIIYIKTDLFYANPSLALLGFHIYRSNGQFYNGERQGITLISRELLQENQRVSYIKQDEKIYYVRGLNEH